MTRTMSLRFALALAAVVASSSAHAERTGGWQVRSGGSSEHFRFSGRYDQLLKVPHPAEWRENRLYLVSHGERKAYAAATAKAARTLRQDSAFRDRFGKIVPSVEIDHESWLAQSSRSGVSFGMLSSKKEDVAREEMAEAIKMAGHLVGEVDTDRSRFVFESSTGKIAGWYVAPPAPRGVATNFKLVRTIGEGANARAYEVRSDDPKSAHFQVIKVLKPYADRRTPREAPPAMLEALTREAEFLSEAFANDKEFASRFGDIIPKTRMLAPGVIAQEMARGSQFDSLGEKAQEKARENIADLRKIAKRIAPGVIVTGRTKNYLFKEDGSIASLYDIASDGHKAYIKAGLKDRVFAHQAAQQAESKPEPESKSDSKSESK